MILEDPESPAEKKFGNVIKCFYLYNVNIKIMDRDKNIYSETDSIKDTGFYYYLRTLNMENDSNVLVLSPIHHYYYNFKELKDVKTLVHMKELNRVDNLKRFINNTVHVLSNNSRFIGCFMDNKIHKDFVYRSQVLCWVFNCFSTRVHRYLSRRKMIKIFNGQGFDIMDISEINGMTYFCVKKT